MADIRSKMVTKFYDLLKKNNFNNYEEFAFRIERGIYNNVIDCCTKKKIIKRWDNKIFNEMYIQKNMSVYNNLNPESYLKNIRIN